VDEIARLADVPLELEAELDQRMMAVREILELDAGSVIRTGKAAGELVNVHIGGTRIGAGEIVSRDGRLAVRMVGFVKRD
jgi:flagellar motor switch protein FliN